MKKRQNVGGDTGRERKKDNIKGNEQEIGRKRGRRGGETMEEREQRNEQKRARVEMTMGSLLS